MIPIVLELRCSDRTSSKTINQKARGRFFQGTLKKLKRTTSSRADKLSTVRSSGNIIKIQNKISNIDQRDFFVGIFVLALTSFYSFQAIHVKKQKTPRLFIQSKF